MAAPDQIWIGRNDDRLGPHTLDRFRALHDEARLQRDDLVWWDGLAEWIPLDTALTELGLGPIVAPTSGAPPPLPSSTGSNADAQRRAASVINTYERSPVARRPGAPISVPLAFAGLILVAAIAAAGFAFVAAPAFRSLGRSAQELQQALSSASIYKVAYAEYVMSNDKVPGSIEEIGLSSAPFGGLHGARIDAGTILLQTSAGQIALQPYRDANHSIIFRCGFADAPTRLEALGQIDSAQATTVPRGDLPSACR